MDNDIAKQIKNGFDAFGGGIKEAGQKRIIELVNKQGYVAYKNEEAAKIFKNNPDYSNWECQVIDGEYRFYPPKENSKKEIDIIDTYKKLKNDSISNTCISIKMLNSSPPKCEYKLLKTDRTTGQQEVIQHEVIEANQKFWMETLPSLYYHFCGSMPVIDNEKDTSINFSSIDGMNMLLIGNLDQNKIDLIKDMKKYVDEKMNLNIDNGKTK